MEFGALNHGIMQYWWGDSQQEYLESVILIVESTPFENDPTYTIVAAATATATATGHHRTVQ